MVGDGLNDAPALASAHVSMAPASASDTGRLASDFIFIKPSIRAVVSAHQTAITVGKIIKQNFAIALVYNCIALPLAMMGYITPLIAAIAMSGSSIAVIANSFRINIGYKKPASALRSPIRKVQAI
jgi:Cu2+-exporting ATPase